MRDPVVDRLEPMGGQGITAFPADFSYSNQLGIKERAKVLRDGRTAHPEGLGQLVDITGPGAKTFEDLPASRMRDGGEYPVDWSGAL